MKAAVVFTRYLIMQLELLGSNNQLLVLFVYTQNPFRVRFVSCTRNETVSGSTRVYQTFTTKKFTYFLPQHMTSFTSFPFRVFYVRCN